MARLISRRWQRALICKATCAGTGAPNVTFRGTPGARFENPAVRVEPSDVPDITEVWYQETGIVYCRMRDEPLVCDQEMFQCHLGRISRR